MKYKSQNNIIAGLFQISENTFYQEWYKQIMEDILEEQLEGKLFLKRISVKFNLSERKEEEVMDKIAIEIPHINIYHEMYLAEKLIGYYSYFLDLDCNFLDEFLYYDLLTES